MLRRSQATKKLTARITRRSVNYYKRNKSMCIKHNYYKRCEVYIKYSKKVWPEPTVKEIEEFVKTTKMPRKYLKNIYGKQKI